MQPWKRTVIWVLIVIFCSGASFIGGSYKAYWAGINSAGAMYTSGMAMQDVIFLKYLRQQKTDTAIKLMEMNLDGNILSHYNQRNFSNSIFNYYFPVFVNRKWIMQPVVEYRKQYPNPIKNPKDIQQTIDKALVQFEKEK